MRDHNYPIYYFGNKCVACDKENTLVKINKFGRTEKSNDLYPIYKIRCTNCGREFFIQWSGDDNKLDHPIAVSRNYIDDFTELLKKRLDTTKTDTSI